MSIFSPKIGKNRRKHQPLDNCKNLLLFSENNISSPMYTFLKRMFYKIVWVAFGPNFSQQHPVILISFHIQGDQIGRFFCLLGDWFLSVVFFLITELAHIFSLLFLSGFLLKKWSGPHFGRFFHKTHLVTLFTFRWQGKIAVTVATPPRETVVAYISFLIAIESPVCRRTSEDLSHENYN
jgi:hypothetical protein